MHVYRQWVPCKLNSYLYACPAVNLCHFSTLLTLSFFNFSQVRHQFQRSLKYIFFFQNVDEYQVTDVFPLTISRCVVIHDPVVFIRFSSNHVYSSVVSIVIVNRHVLFLIHM